MRVSKGVFSSVLPRVCCIFWWLPSFSATVLGLHGICDAIDDVEPTWND